MKRRIGLVAVVIVLAFAAAQLVRPQRVNPPTDPGRAIQAHPSAAGDLVAVLDRSCRDCHSNRTQWAWYTGVAPVSWLMAYGVNEGRRAVNFDEWGSYSPEQQRSLLARSCADVRDGKMPGAYAILHPEMRLSERDVETICAAAR